MDSIYFWSDFQQEIGSKLTVFSRDHLLIFILLTFQGNTIDGWDLWNRTYFLKWEDELKKEDSSLMKLSSALKTAAYWRDIYFILEFKSAKKRTTSYTYYHGTWNNLMYVKSEVNEVELGKRVTEN